LQRPQRRCPRRSSGATAQHRRHRTFELRRRVGRRGKTPAENLWLAHPV